MAAVGGLVLVAATGCASEDLPTFAIGETASSQADTMLSLWQGSWIAALAVGALVWGLILWSVIFHRKRSDHAPEQTRYNVPIEVLYTVVPVLIIGVLFFFTARDETGSPSCPTTRTTPSTSSASAGTGRSTTSTRTSTRSARRMSPRPSTCPWTRPSASS